MINRFPYRVVRTAEELDALPVGSVIMDVELADLDDSPMYSIAQREWTAAENNWDPVALWHEPGSSSGFPSEQFAEYGAEHGFYVLFEPPAGRL